MRTSTRFAILTACALGAACSDSTAPAVDNTLASVLTLVNSTDLYAYPGAVNSGALILPPVQVPVQVPIDACPYDANTQFFVCAEFTQYGLTVTRSYQLLNAGGAPLSEFDGRAVEGIRAVTHLVGIDTFRVDGVPDWAMTVSYDRHVDQTISNLRTRARTLFGSANTVAITNINGRLVSDTITTDETDDNVVLPVPSADDNHIPLPYSGSMTFNSVLPSVTGPGKRTVDVVLTYDGTPTMRMLINETDQAPRSKSCTMDIVSQLPRLTCSS